MLAPLWPLSSRIESGSFDFFQTGKILLCPLSACAEIDSTSRGMLVLNVPNNLKLTGSSHSRKWKKP